MELDAIKTLRLISKAYEEQSKEKAWEMWLSLYPNMTKKTFTPFSKFYSELKRPLPRKSNLSKEDIIAKAEKIKQSDLKHKS